MSTPAVIIKKGLNKATPPQERIWITSPYHPHLPAKFRELGGIWKAETKQWVLDARDEQRARKVLIDVLGTDGSPVTEELVTVTVRPGLRGRREYYLGTDEIWLFGWQIARRPDRDARVQLGHGVIVVAGHFRGSGGSRKNPDINADEDVVLLVRDVPRSMAEKAAAQHLEAVQIGDYVEADEAVKAIETVEAIEAREEKVVQA